MLEKAINELVVKSPVKVGKKSVAEEKVIAALKSHSEAERRRRERINAHLDTLRTLLPYREKVVQVEYKVEYEG
ncbi:Transcription factor AIG1 -like protein [Gossypium arboreum]|uniref:Transcription factor AIG1-like protein n=1 Tax=Gossypium arboreum TaxID=29729 RepID=A0A0B0NX22_GOSAR|nr:Transcription factor AIG1 -like protein [Gossypium arboreum]